MLQIYKFFLASQDPARKNHLKGGVKHGRCSNPQQKRPARFHWGLLKWRPEGAMAVFPAQMGKFGNYFITLVTVWLPSLIVVTTMLTPCQGSLALMPAALR